MTDEKEPRGTWRSGRTESVEATPEQQATARRSTTRFSLLVIATILASTLRIPWLVLALPLAVATIWVGISLLRGARGTPVVTWTPFVIVGLAITGFMALSTAASLASWPAIVELQECSDRALTLSAQAECEATFTASRIAWISSVGGNG